MERRWLSLAHSYEFAERLSNYVEPFRNQHPHTTQVTAKKRCSFNPLPETTLECQHGQAQGRRRGGASMRVLLHARLPTCDDLKYVNARGVFPYASLQKRIAAQNIRYINFGAQIAKGLKDSHLENRTVP